ncbi:MAG: glycosyltransferase family 39 protein [Planctomycetota bacterium]
MSIDACPPHPSARLVLPLLTALVLVLAAWLRLPILEQTPPGLLADEASIGLDAWCIWETGADQNGRAWPLLCHSQTDSNEALYRYLAAPVVGTFGLNAASVRTPAALAGILTVLGVILLARRLWGPGPALIAGLTLALSPWHLHYSRVATPAILLPLFLVWGAYWVWRGLDGKRGSLWIGALVFSLALWCDSSARYVVAPLLAGLLLLRRQSLRATGVLSAVSFGMFGVALLGFAFVWSSSDAMARAPQAPGGESGRWFASLLSYLSPQFLLFEGGPDARDGLPGFGVLGPVSTVLALVGFVAAWRNWRSPGAGFLFVWLLLYPLPGMLTGPYQATRVLHAAPLFALLGGLGFASLARLPRTAVLRRLVMGGMLAAVLLQGAHHAWHYFRHYGRLGAQAWMHGVREVFEVTRDDPAEKLWISDQFPAPWLYVPFYRGMETRELQRWFQEHELASRLGSYRMAGIQVGPVENALASDREMIWIVTAAEWTGTEPSGVDVRHVVMGPAGGVEFWILHNRP